MKNFVLIIPVVCMLFVSAIAQTGQLSADQYFDLGEQALNAGKYKEARDYFSRCLTLNARHGEAIRQRAQAKEGLNDWIGAAVDYSAFLEYQPDHAETLFSRAVARYQAKQFEFALEDFNRLLVLPPSETTSIFYAQLPFGGGTNQVFTTSTLKNFIFDYIGLTEFGLKRYNKALVYFDSAIRLDGKVADFYAHRGMAQEALQNYEGAKNDYIIALSYDRDHSIAQHNLDRLPVKKEKIELEEVTLTQSIEHDPHLPYPYRERAFYRFKKANYRGALEDYNKAIGIDTMDIETWLNRGLVKEKLTDLRGAYSDYTNVIDLQENNSKAWMSRGNILSKMGRDKEAIEDYTIVIFYYPDYAQAYYNRAIVKQRMGNLQDACADFKLATQYGMTVSERLMKAACEAP